jgi:hypothetical protein
LGIERTFKNLIALVGEPAESTNTVKRAIQADDRLPVVETEAGDPIVIFPEPLSHSPIQVSGEPGDAIMEPVNAPMAEVFPSSVSRWKRNRYLGEADNGGPQELWPLSGNESPGRANPESASLSDPVD